MHACTSAGRHDLVPSTSAVRGCANVRLASLRRPAAAATGFRARAFNRFFCALPLRPSPGRSASLPLPLTRCGAERHHAEEITASVLCDMNRASFTLQVAESKVQAAVSKLQGRSTLNCWTTSEARARSVLLYRGRVNAFVRVTVLHGKRLLRL